MKNAEKLLAQGATEYLVLLAVVLIIALVSIALLGFFPGLASGAKQTQLDSYWKTATPIAVQEAVANYDTTGGNLNSLTLVLQNTGSTPIELVAISRGEANNPGNTYTAEFGAVNISGYPEFFSPYWISPADGFQAYIAPPAGTGRTDYNKALSLAPGEQATVGFLFATASYPPVVSCGNSVSTARKQMEIPELYFYYVSIVDGNRVFKKQTGAKPLIAPCVETQSLPF